MRRSTSTWRRDDIVGAYTGLRPLASDPGQPGSTVKASREHRIRIDANGLVRICGGKYTTYRLMAAQTVDAALGRDVARVRPSRTAELALVGAAARRRARTPRPSDRERDGPRPGPWPGGWSPGTAARRRGRPPRSASSTCCDRSDPTSPISRSRSSDAVRGEAALSLDDVLARRTRLALELADRGAAIVAASRRARGRRARLVERRPGPAIATYSRRPTASTTCPTPSPSRAPPRSRSRSPRSSGPELRAAMDEPLILALDQGTTSSRAIAFDPSRPGRRRSVRSSCRRYSRRRAR